MKQVIFKLITFGSLCLFFSFSKKEPHYTNITQDLNPKQESIVRGEKIYMDHCSRCHLPDGKGVPGETPPLANSNWLIEKPNEVIHAIKYGLKGKIEVNGIPYKGFMPKQKMESQQTADVMNYIMNSWGNKNDKLISIDDIEAVTKK